MLEVVIVSMATAVIINSIFKRKKKYTIKYKTVRDTIVEWAVDEDILCDCISTLVDNNSIILGVKEEK